MTADSDKPRISVTTISERSVTSSESPVTLFRNQRSRYVGIRNYLLAIAVGGGADHLVTGDKRDLLTLQRYAGTSIIAVSTFVALHGGRMAR